jgi:hypothetical protein
MSAFVLKWLNPALVDNTGLGNMSLPGPPRNLVGVADNSVNGFQWAFKSLALKTWTIGRHPLAQAEQTLPPPES